MIREEDWPPSPALLNLHDPEVAEAVSAKGDDPWKDIFHSEGKTAIKRQRVHGPELDAPRVTHELVDFGRERRAELRLELLHSVRIQAGKEREPDGLFILVEKLLRA